MIIFLFIVFGCVVIVVVWWYFYCVLFSNYIVSSFLPCHNGSWKPRLGNSKLNYIFFLIGHICIYMLRLVFRKGLALICGAHFIKNFHFWEESLTACLWANFVLTEEMCFYSTYHAILTWNSSQLWYSSL